MELIMRSIRIHDLAIASLFVNVSAFAETSQLSVANARLSPVVVTATKVEKDPLDVPFGLSVLTREDLDNKNINSVEGVIHNSANTNLVSSGDGRANSNTIKIRGMGPLGGAANAEDTSVVVYVDGIPVPASAIANGYFDAERIEVLKGPQGTLFGRNSAGGAINIVTPTPTDETEFSLQAQTGENNHHLVTAIASGAIEDDKLFGRLSITTQEDGAYIDNLNDDDIGDVKKQLTRGTLFFTPSDSTDIKLTLSAERDRRSYVTFGPLRSSASSKMAVQIDADNAVDKDAYGAGLTISHELTNFNFTSVTGIHDIDISQYVDGYENSLFPSNYNGYFSDWDEQHQTFSQEFRLNSHSGTDIAWVTGLSYYHSDFDAVFIDGVEGMPSFNSTRDVELISESYSWFGEVTVPMNNSLDIVAGIRYTDDSKEEDLKYTGMANPSRGQVASANRQHELNDNFVTGRASLIYKIDPQSRLFATLSRGHKAGGFQQYSTSIATGLITKEAFKESEINAFELGYKLRSQDGRFNMSSSVFINNIKDEQVFEFDAKNTLRILNADARTKGMELETNYQLSNAWQLAANLGYVDAELRNNGVEFDTRTGAKAGNALPVVSKWSGGLSMAYRERAPWLNDNAELFGALSWQYTGSSQADIKNSLKLRKFNTINLKLGANVTPKLELYGFANNLLDDYQEQFGTNQFGGKGISVGRDRVMGIGFKYQL
jgi:iron complex outermembrane receptor protein